MQVVVFFVHGGHEAAWCGEGLACHGGDHFVGVRALGFGHRLRPHVDADVGGFHRVIGQRFVFVAGNALGFGVVAPGFDEGGVGGVLHRHEIVPRSQVAHQRFGVHTTQLFFTHAEGDDGHVRGLQTLVAQLFVERHVGVAVDGGDDSCLLALGCKLLDLGNDGLVVAVAEGGVLLDDVSLGHTFRFQKRAENFVGGAGVHVVGAQQNKPFG